MAATAFNPLKAAQDLEAAGFERRQAEAIAKVVNRSDERAATKADLDAFATAFRSELDTLATTLRSELDAFATTLRSELRAVNSRVDTVNSRIDALNSRISALQWVVGIQSAITLATFAIVAAKLL